MQALVRRLRNVEGKSYLLAKKGQKYEMVLPRLKDEFQKQMNVLSKLLILPPDLIPLVLTNLLNQDCTSRLGLADFYQYMIGKCKEEYNRRLSWYEYLTTRDFSRVDLTTNRVIDIIFTV